MFQTAYDFSAVQAAPKIVLPPGFEIGQLIAALSALTRPTPVPLTQWQQEINEAYKGKCKSTRLRMAQAIREAVALAGPGATTEALTPALVERFAQRPGKASTNNGLLASLRRAMKLAAKKGQLAYSVPAECVWVVEDVDPPRERHHSRETVAKVLEAFKAKSDSWEGGRLYAFAAILAYAGLRKMEALRLRVEDVDLKRGFVHVRANGRRLKTRASRAPVPLPEALVEVLRDWLPRCGSEWVIPKVGRDGPWIGGTYGRRPGDRLRDAAAEVGVVGFTPHTLRHSLATHLAGFWGLSTKQIRMILRHSRDSTQTTYIHEDLINLRLMVRGFDFLAEARHKRSKPVRKRKVKRSRVLRRLAG